MINPPVKTSQDFMYVMPSHIRAARGWLGWNLDEMQEKSGLSRDTISRFERGKQKIANDTRAVLFQTCFMAGVELLPDGLRARGMQP